MEAAPPATALPAPPTLSARALRTQAFRAAADLCRARLGASGAGRFALAAAIVIALGAFVIALSIRVTDGPAAPVSGLLRRAAGAIAWVSGGILALAAARDATASDRAEGVEALVAARGVSASLLRAARTLGVSSHIARTLALPLGVLGLSTAALAADVESAVRRVMAGLALFVWASIAGVTLGALAALFGRLFRARGATALFVFVLGERMLVDALGLGAWSVPGALGAAFSLLMGATGIGGGR